MPGWTNAWTAPVRARIDMMATGVRTPVGIRIVAPTPERLDALGSAVQAAAARVPGTRSAVYEGLGGETRPIFELDRDALARHDVDPARARAVADLVLAGGDMGELPVPADAANRTARTAARAPVAHGAVDGQAAAGPGARRDRARGPRRQGTTGAARAAGSFARS